MLPSPTDRLSASPYPWRFFRVGGVDQVRLDKGADIFALDQLDQKLWVALSCPTSGLDFDSRTLELLDTDKDGHVRPREILDTVAWLRSVLKSGDCLLKGTPEFQLEDLRTDTKEGRLVLSSAQHVLKELGKPATTLTLGEASKSADFFAMARLNGDGIVPPQSIEDAKLRAVIDDVITCIGSLVDRSGKAGINQQLLDTFFAECAAFTAWTQQSESAGTDGGKVLAFGSNTKNMFAALEAVRKKIDDYFARCRLAAFDVRALAALNREETAYLEVAARDFSITAQEVAHFPLAMIAAEKSLPLDTGINPAWAEKIADFRANCCAGKNSLKESEWLHLNSSLDPYRNWLANKKGALVEGLAIERIHTILASTAKAVLTKALAEDAAVAPEIDAIHQCEKLALLCRDFSRLLNNYVSFTDFYARRFAIFQAGTLFLDGRSCDLCFKVSDAAKHGTLAAMAKTYLAYVDCTRPNNERMTVACAFTAGDSDNLFVGRNGIFYDRKGRDWNATITKVIDNPISIGQSFWSPYKKVVRFIEESVAKRAAAADNTAKIQSATLDAVSGTGDQKPKPKFDIGMLAAIGVALGSLATATSGLLAAFFGLGAWIPLGFLGLILAISGPSMLIAWLKLRHRNLGPILDANGWAVNTLTKINVPLGGSLTTLPTLPAGATRSLIDPFAPKSSPWPKVIAALLLLALLAGLSYRFNLLHKWFPTVVPEYVSADFDGPNVATEGELFVEIRLGSGAKSVMVQGLDGINALDVDTKTMMIKVPLNKAVVGKKIILIDTSPEHSETHDINVVAKKKAP